MKREITPQPQKKKGLLVLYRVIMALIIALVLVLITGSLYAVLRPDGSAPLFRIGTADGMAAGTAGRTGGPGSGGPASSLADGDIAVFSGIGRLRIPVAGQLPATVILSISFPYPPGDRAFAEELASRISEFRSIATGYFASLPLEKIINMDEDAVKAEILRRYNALLRLGRIETLYFGDLLIVE